MSNGKDRPKNTKRTIADHRTVKWFIAGLSLVGAAVGYFAGLSDSPVIANLLPLLFGLVGGSSGFLLLTKGIKSPSSRHQLNVIGKALIAFCLPCIIASAYAVSIRTGAPVSSFVPSWRDNESDSVLGSGANSGVDLRLALLDAKLAKMGVGPSDRKTIVRKAAIESEGNVGEEYVRDLEQLQLKAAALLDVLKPVVGPDDERTDHALRDGYESHPVVDRLVSQLRLIAQLVPQWVRPAANGEPRVVPRSAIAGFVTDLAATLKLFPGTPVARRPRPVETYPVYEWIFRYAVEFDYPRLVDYERYVYVLEAKYATGDWVGDKDLPEAIDEYIQATSVSESGNEVRPRPRFKP